MWCVFLFKSLHQSFIFLQRDVLKQSSNHPSTFLFGILGKPTCTLPETNGLHLKIDGWNSSFLFGWPIFRGYVSFRECRNREKARCTPPPHRFRWSPCSEVMGFPKLPSWGAATSLAATCGDIGMDPWGSTLNLGREGGRRWWWWFLFIYIYIFFVGDYKCWNYSGSGNRW